MIAITGSTGELGSDIVGFLIQKGFNPAHIIGLARNEEKAQRLKDQGVTVRLGSYDDYPSLVAAFQGARKVLLISGNEMDKRIPQHLQVIQAAKAAGVDHILYTSVQRQSDRPDSPINFVTTSHIETENAIKASGLKYTLLRNNLYMDMLPWVLGQDVFNTGIFYPAKEGRVGYTLKRDIAEATANVLLSDKHENKSYNISNPHALGFAEVAAHLSALANKPVHYISPSVDVYKSTMLGFGVPAMAVDMLAGFAVGAEQGELVSGESDLPRLLQRDPVSYKEFLNRVYTKP